MSVWIVKRSLREKCRTLLRPSLSERRATTYISHIKARNKNECESFLEFLFSNFSKVTFRMGQIYKVSVKKAYFYEYHDII